MAVAVATRDSSGARQVKSRRKEFLAFVRPAYFDEKNNKFNDLLK